MKPVASAALGAVLAASALGLIASQAHADPRIQTTTYDPDAVVRLDGCFGYQTLIQFGPDEAIENVGLGDAAQWLVTPNKRGDRLFIKPAYRTTRGNMTVLTNRRSYAFELSAQASARCARGEVVYTLRFAYPQDAVEAATIAETPASPEADGAPAEPSPAARNLAYTYSGAAENVPVRVFDDGRSTWFRWSEGTTTPAVYAVAADHTETAVAFTGQGDWLVAPVVAPAFVLRRGNAVATLFNDAYQTPALDAGSPQPRQTAAAASSRPWLARVFSRTSSDVR